MPISESEHKINIMVIEDDSDIVWIIRTLLEREGYKVHSADNGEKAIYMLEDLHPDLILCDIMLPFMNGYEIRKIIQQDADLQLVPFIYLSALTSSEHKMKAFELNPDDYITKPFEPAELVARIKAKLRKYHLYESLIKFDTLTQVLNRRAFMSQLTIEMERVERYNRILSLLMIDIDNFKRINDKYGHPVGDAVLKSIGIALQSNFRDIDFIGRYGGEEFLICMPEANKEKCLLASNRLRTKIEDNSTIEPSISFTISGGIAEAPLHGLNVKTILLNVDKALYTAKKNGKNCIVVFEK